MNINCLFPMFTTVIIKFLYIRTYNRMANKKLTSYNLVLRLNLFLFLIYNNLCFSNPTPQITEMLPVRWDPIVKLSPYYYMNIDSDLKLKQRPFHNRMAFWDLFYKFNENYYGGYMNNVQYC